MEIILWLLPVCITLFVIGWRAWHSWHDGLFLAVLELGVTMLAAVLAFFLTRLLINPESIDLFGMGQLLVDKLPPEFLTAAPSYEAFLLALPTAIVALLFFSVMFEMLRVIGCKILSKLNKKHNWDKEKWVFRASRGLAVAVGALTAVVCVLVDLVAFSGTVTIAANMLDCAQAATSDPTTTATAQAFHELEENPVFHLCNTLGCKDVFCELTSARRDGEKFSVGQEMIDVSQIFADSAPIFDALPTDDTPPTPEQLRALPEALGDSPEVMELMTALICSNTSQLGESDAVLILSTVLGTTPDQFTAYLSQLDAETAHEDLTTFCNIAALLAEQELLPAAGQEIPLSDFRDEDLLARIRQEAQKNPQLMEKLNIAE